jgi:MFS family permease
MEAAPEAAKATAEVPQYSSRASTTSICQDDNPPREQSTGDHDVEKATKDQQNLPTPWSVFTYRQKCWIVVMVSVASFFSPLSANIYFPALETLSKDFNTSESVMNLTLTSYMIFQGLAPTIFGDFADMAGRRPAYIIGFVLYLAANAGLANSNTFVALLILRCLQSTGSSSTIALGSAVVADMCTSAERGTFMGWATSSAMFAPAIAPVLGGVFTELLGWRWIFWYGLNVMCTPAVDQR